MKTLKLKALALAALCISACNKTETTGTLSFVLTEGEVAEVTKGSVSSYATLPSTSDFSLLVKDAQGSTIYSGTLGTWDETTSLAAGNYTVSASYGSEYDEGAAKPYFLGTANFAIQGAQTTSVTIPVTLGNCIVKAATTENFRNYYPEYSFKVSTPDNAAGFDCTTGAVFVAYQFTVSGTVTSQSGKTFSLESKTWKGDPATCYTVTYDVTNVGGVSVTVSFNDTVETVTLDEIELN